jgi:hypothetical protein
MTTVGFPHSDIPGSKLAYSSPRRFVVRYVLLRLLVPRHPPCALSCLTFRFFFFGHIAFASFPLGNRAPALRLQNTQLHTSFLTLFFRYLVFKEQFISCTCRYNMYFRPTTRCSIDRKKHLITGDASLSNNNLWLCENGGAKRDRTADLLLARQALSQLSYGPMCITAVWRMVGPSGLEPPTSPLSGVRSNQLS